MPGVLQQHPRTRLEFALDIYRTHKGVEGQGMIRIIAGDFKGRRLKTPSSDAVRPTGDRVREAWFSILQRPLRGARVLDLFAGSGALGLEALSRGAVSADFVEIHRLALSSLKANITLLKVDDRTVVQVTYTTRVVP